MLLSRSQVRWGGGGGGLCLYGDEDDDDQDVIFQEWELKHLRSHLCQTVNPARRQCLII